MARTMKAIEQAALVLIALSALPVVSNAAVIFSEDFSSLSGPALNPAPNPNPFDSQRGTGTYFALSGVVSDWTLEGNSAQIIGFDRDLSGLGTGGDNALLLNEVGGVNGIYRTISGLVAGAQYVLSFDYWADNRVSPDDYTFSYEINNTTMTVGPTSSSGLNSGVFYSVSVPFTFIPLAPGGTSTVLRFRELNTDAKQASPIFDNISISVPEPGSLALIGLGLLGIGAARRRRSAG